MGVEVGCRLVGRCRTIKTVLSGNESRFCHNKRPRDQSFNDEFSDMGWVRGAVSSVSCRASLHLSGMKGDFVWTGSAGKCTSCGVLFIVVECSKLHCSDEFS